MSLGLPYFVSADTRELELLRGKWLWVSILGGLLILIGLLALAYPGLATVETAIVFGGILIVSGVLQVSTAAWARGWGGLFLNVLVGLLYAFVGMVLIDRPLLAAKELTLLLAVFLVAAGLVRVVAALVHRFSGWGWVLLNGAVTLVLGVLVWRHWPGDGLWVIGTLVGIELLFSGWSLVMLGLAVRATAKSANPS
jgi:uncharacterized membrane protein HdeD (DUF308 family)